MVATGGAFAPRVFFLFERVLGNGVVQGGSLARAGAHCCLGHPHETHVVPQLAGEEGYVQIVKGLEDDVRAPFPHNTEFLELREALECYFGCGGKRGALMQNVFERPSDLLGARERMRAGEGRDLLGGRWEIIDREGSPVVAVGGIRGGVVEKGALKGCDVTMRVER